MTDPGKDLSLYRLLFDPWVRKHLKPYNKYFVQVVAIVAATIAINFAVPFTSRALVNVGILAENPVFVDLVLFVQIFMYLSLIFLNATRTRITSHISNRLVMRMAKELSEHLIHLPMHFYHSAKSGEFCERIRDLDRVQRFMAIELVDAVVAIVTVVTLALVLAIVDFTICVTFVVFAAVYLCWVLAIGRRRRKTDAENFLEGARSRALEIAMVSGIQDIKIAGYENEALSTWASIQIQALQTRLNAASIEHLQATGGHLLTRSGMVLITFISAKKAIFGEISIGDFTIVAVIVVQLYFHLNQLLGFTNKIEDVRAAIQRANEVRGLDIENNHTSGRGVTPTAWAPIVLDSVNVRYPGARRDILKSVSFKIEAQAMTALVGPSGSGKSTILKALLRLHDPSRGEISVNGVPIQDIDLREWRRGVGAVMQEGSLFSATIRSNIVAAQPLDKGWLAEIVSAARLDDVIQDARDGLDTLVGTGEAHLSTGQVQRILIARALYKRPKLLLLDEATSALDLENESLIMQSVCSIIPGMTTIVAAHRSNAIGLASRVILVESGRAVNVS